MEKREIDLLVLRVSAGDDKAFETLYGKMQRGVFAFAYTYLGNYADAEDAVQETFLTVKRKAGLYRAGSDGRAWIFQIAKNYCLDEIRKRKLRREREDAPVLEPYAEPRLPLLSEMVKELDADEKEIVILHAVWGYKHREIAEITGAPLGTVTWKYPRAIEKLKEKEERENV